MKRTLTKFLALCCIIMVLVLWNKIYTDLFLDDNVIYKEDFSLSNLFILILLGLKEEFIFRYLPFILTVFVYLKSKKNNPKLTNYTTILSAIFILSIQIIFSSLHTSWDPIYREIFYNLPPYPTFGELINTFLLHGVVGLALCISYIIYIPKDNPLSLLQGKSLLASCFVHIVYNQLVQL